MNPEFWKDRKVLITGHTGFKGSWLSLWLKHLGAKVHGYALPPESISLYNICKLNDKLDSYCGDINSVKILSDVIEYTRPEIIFHLAAQALVCDSYIDPVGTFKTNVMGTANLLNIVKQNPYIKSVLVITSDKCYNNQQSTVHKETDDLGGEDPYSASKACTELVVNSFRSSIFNSDGVDTAVATARAGNVIGGGDWGRDRLIPDIARSLLTNQAIVLRNPKGVRPWQYVLDVLLGYMKLAERLTIEGKSYAEAWNFGPDGSNISAAELTDRFLYLWEAEKTWLDGSDFRTYKESEVLKLDCSKAHEKLGWHPVLPIERSILETAQWYHAYMRNLDMLKFTENQLVDYEDWMDS